MSVTNVPTLEPAPNSPSRQGATEEHLSFVRTAPRRLVDRDAVAEILITDWKRPRLPLRCPVAPGAPFPHPDRRLLARSDFHALCAVTVLSRIGARIGCVVFCASLFSFSVRAPAGAERSPP
ncbi:hypothetical protein SAMN04487905_10342 [Actinopolyspora xinjiangensis]|uniref:Uncharacterized protein n=1 Tax=Actinopolyspora xinjiangensis TaxID=405564 RepID=A0A1H0RF13_9ACTN|nr:hypothetical protein SAMN04487905_10342 [Actinopolyspora xinjiangensis]